MNQIEMICMIGGCDNPAAHIGFCDHHFGRLRDDERWVPIFWDQREDAEAPLVCGLCGNEVWGLFRVDRENGTRIAIDAHPSTEGRCLLGGNGFRVVDDTEAALLHRAGVPLYRAHGPICAIKSKLLAAADDE